MDGDASLPECRDPVIHVFVTENKRDKDIINEQIKKK